MGDKPVIIPAGAPCAYSIYQPGHQPLEVIAQFSGIEKSPGWPVNVPPPPNGVFKCLLAACGLWQAPWESGHVSVVATVYTSFLEIWLLDDLYPAFRYGAAPLWPGGEPRWPGGHLGGPSANSDADPYWIGTGDVYLPSADSVGKSFSPSWDAAPLVGVPTTSLNSNPKPSKWSGYFAEELPTDIAARKLRYARHADGSNVKVFMI